MLTGYKTYILSALGVIDAAAIFLGYINANDGLTILSFLGFGSIAALRSAVKTETLAALTAANIPVPTE